MRERQAYCIHCSKSLTALHEGELEDKAEVLLEEMGPEQPLVDALDPRQLAFLAGGEVLGVLRERVGGSV